MDAAICGGGGNKRSENYVEIVEKLLSSCRALGVQHVIETPWPATQLDIFPGNMGAVSDEHGQSFHEVISRTGEKKIQQQMEPKHVG